MRGADLADGTPVYDVKPYVEYADSKCGVRSGFVDSSLWEPLEVRIPESVLDVRGPDDSAALSEVLAQDPRPRYQDDPERRYGLVFGEFNVKFFVKDSIVFVDSLEKY